MSDELLEERRRWKRRHLVHYLEVFNAEHDQHLGNVMDITAHGLMLVSEKPIEKDVEFQLRLTLPKGIQKNEISFSAQSRWCKRDVSPDLYITGFKIISIRDQERAVIESLIHRHGFRD